MQTIQRFFIMVCLTGMAMAAQASGNTAAGWQNHAAIIGTAQSFLTAFATAQHEGRVETRLNKLDPRLRLKACSMPVEAFMPSGGRAIGNTTVGVRCPDEGGWSIYVSGRIDVFGEVLVARQPISRGQAVQPQDLEFAERNLGNLPYGYYSEDGAVEGMIAKRTISATSVITPQMLSAPKLVKRGERVSLIAETGGLKVRMTGQAMSDGIAGQLIRVRADSSKRVVDGTVVEPGVVKVTL